MEDLNSEIQVELEVRRFYSKASKMSREDLLVVSTKLFRTSLYSRRGFKDIQSHLRKRKDQ